MSKAKPFRIAKQVVWDAYKRVKANQGAAGVDGESIAEFERDLKKNLYKLWNRMSSGSYFPPPVRTVEIPKDSGGTRTLGIPTVADRIAQMVAKMYLEPLVEPHFHQTLTGTGPASQQFRQLGSPGKGAGAWTGCWTWISRASSTTWIMPCCCGRCGSIPTAGGSSCTWKGGCKPLPNYRVALWWIGKRVLHRVE